MTASPSAEPPRGAVDPRAGALGECPACQGPLHPWVRAYAADARRDETYLLDRCESCGLGIQRGSAAHPAAGTGAPQAAASAVPSAGAEAGNGGALVVRAPNRRSLQAALGEGRWAGIEVPDNPLQLTPRSLALLVEAGGGRLERLRYPLLGRNQLWMWQTLMNAFTFHPNFAREAVAGRLRPGRGLDRAKFAADALVSVLAGPLVAIVSVPAELIAALVRRGGEISARVVADQASSATSSASSAGQST